MGQVQVCAQHWAHFCFPCSLLPVSFGNPIDLSQEVPDVPVHHHHLASIIHNVEVLIDQVPLLWFQILVVLLFVLLDFSITLSRVSAKMATSSMAFLPLCSRALVITCAMTDTMVSLNRMILPHFRVCSILTLEPLLY
jgi:hypothetical protein